MADLDLRFDDITEQYSSKPLAELRDYARTTTLPARLSMEIGSNKGQFLRGLARKNPEKFYLGVELRRKWANQANHSFEKEGIDNAHILSADAFLALPILVDAGQLEELFVLYPDPWWKVRHRRRRVIQTDNLDLLSEKMCSGANLWVRTDVGPLANDMRADPNAHPDFEPLPLEAYPLDPFPYSERDTLTIKKSLPVQLLYYRKR